MKKITKYIIVFIIINITIILIAWIYKFNFTDDDIYVEKDWKIVPINQTNE